MAWWAGYRRLLRQARASRLAARPSASRFGLVPQEILEPVDIVLAVLHIRFRTRLRNSGSVSLDAVDDEFIEGSSELHQSLGSRSTMNDQLANQRIE